MQAVSILNPGKFQYIEIPQPDFGENDVLLRTHTVGFCGTDLHIFNGTNPLVTYPRIPGHEIAAIIEKTGRRVPSHIQPGAHVTLSPLQTCGKCSACKRQRFNCCAKARVMGVHRDGAFTNFITAPWQSLFVAEKLSFSELALVEPLTIGFHAVDRAQITSEDKVAVLGCGAIGLGVIAAASERGAKVIAVDIVDGKLDLAQKIGATGSVNSKSSNLQEKLHELTGGEGPDVIIEAVGAPETFLAAVQHVAPAGRVVYVGWSKQPITYDTKNFILKELDIRGSRNSLPKDYHSVIEYLEQSRFPVQEVVNLTVPFSEAGNALRTWSDAPSQFTKIQVTFNPA